MPLAKSAQLRIDPKKILLTSNGLAELVDCHHATPLSALARGQIEAAAWIDFRGKLSPLFCPTQAMILGRLLPHDPQPPTIS